MSMPYTYKKRSYTGNRRARRPRKPYTPKPWYERKYTPYQLARNAYNGVQYIRRLINVERKKVDFSTTGWTFTPSGSVTSLCAIAQGDGDNNRTGNSVRLQYLLWRGSIARDAAASTSLCRIMIIKDLQQIADTSPGVTDILDQDVALPTDAPLNSNTVGRFKVLADKRIRLDDATGTEKMFKFYLPLNHHVRYNGANTTDVQKGNVYALIVSLDPTYPPTIQGFCRIAYTDN